MAEQTSEIRYLAPQKDACYHESSGKCKLNQNAMSPTRTANMRKTIPSDASMLLVGE